MDQKTELKNTFLEEYSSAVLLKGMGKVKSSVILLSKALFALCDYLIFTKYSLLPKNHGERFRILELKEKEIYVLVDSVWAKYTETYSHPSGEEAYKILNKAILEIAKNGSIDSEIKEMVEK